MRIWPEKTQDQEFNELGSRGFKGSLNDRQYAYLLAAGYKGALADMSTSYRAYSPKLLFASSEVGVWYDPSDLTTMFQDSAGTIPVTAVGQPVGLRLDKSKGLVLGPEQHQGDISTSPWSTVGTLSSITVNSYTNSSGVGAGVALFVGLGKCVRVDVRYSKDTASSFSIRRSGAAADTAEYAASTELTGSFSVIVRMTGDLDKVYLRLAGNGNVTFSNISVRELPGNHASQSTPGSRAIYASVPKGGRRNLLTQTENFGSASWVRDAFGAASVPSVISTTETNPFGAATASIVRFNTGAGTTSGDASRLIGNPLLALNAVAHTGSIWARVASGTAQVEFSISGAGGSASLVTLTTSWQRVSFSGTPSSAFNLAVITRGNFASGITDVFLWGAQLETGSTATNYQRVGSIYDITEAGVQTLYGLLYDGLDDFYVTPTITPGTDKVQVFAGVRKLSDAARGMLAELSADINTNNGAFSIEAPDANAAASYRPRSKGTVIATIGGLSAYAAPVSSVLSTLASISDDNLIQRVNGSQVGSSATDQGTGNYLAYPLYIGRRGGTSLPYNGYEFGLIVRFGANLSEQRIKNTENWLNERTRGY